MTDEYSIEDPDSGAATDRARRRHAGLLRGFVHRGAQVPAPTFDAGWDAATAASFLAISSDKTTATYTDLEGWTGIQHVKALAFDASLSKVYFEALFDPVHGSGSDYNFADPQYFGLVGAAQNLDDVWPEHVDMPIGVSLWEPGHASSHLEWYVRGVAVNGGFAESLDEPDSRLVMLAWDREANLLHVGQGGRWICGNPDGSAAYHPALEVSGSDLLLYIYSLQPTTVGRFSAADLSCVAPAGYAACDGSSQAGVLTYAGATNIAIPEADPAGVESSINVPTSTPAAAVAVSVTITHPVFWDLTVTLSHGANSWDVLVEPEAEGTHTFTLSVPFAADAQGDWTLKVVDAYTWESDTGAMDSWSLRVLPASS